MNEPRIQDIPGIKKVLPHMTAGVSGLSEAGMVYPF